MTLEETRKRILEDDEFVISECKKLQTLYALKKTIRYSMLREEQIDTESVAEHIFALHALAEYFLPLEESGNVINKERVHQLVEFHDIDEIITGDFVSFNKTPEQVKAGKDAVPEVIERLPDSLKEMVAGVLSEYEAQTTIEAKFAKALDKIEPSFHVFNENGKEINHKLTHATYNKHRKIKDPYTAPFPLIHHFSDVLSRTLKSEGFFLPDA